MQAKVVY